MDQPYRLMLHELQTNFYTVSSPDLPTFHADVTGSYIAEALYRAQEAMHRWLVYQRESGAVLPPTQVGGGYAIFGGGASPTDGDRMWSKRDLYRITGLSRATIDRRIKDGTLKRRRVGGRTLFVPVEVRAAFGLG